MRCYLSFESTVPTGFAMSARSHDCRIYRPFKLNSSSKRSSGSSRGTRPPSPTRSSLHSGSRSMTLTDEESKAVLASIKRERKKREKTADSGDGSAREKQADILIAIAKQATLFHTHEGVAFADIVIRGHRQTWPVQSGGFRRWLVYCFFKQKGGAPNAGKPCE